MDSNGTIDFSEFLLAVSITSNSTDIRQKLKWMFRIYDIGMIFIGLEFLKHYLND